MLQIVSCTTVVSHTAVARIIFFLSGAVIEESIENVSARDWLLLLVLYIALHLVRGIVVFLSWGVMKICAAESSSNFTYPEGCVMVFSGLRGAVGLALGMSVLGESGINKVCAPTRLPAPRGGTHGATSANRMCESCSCFTWRVSPC